MLRGLFNSETSTKPEVDNMMPAPSDRDKLDNSDDDISLTPPSPGKMTKQHSSPETWSKNDKDADLDNRSDGKKSPTELKDGQRRTRSYMSSVSSDADDIQEKPKRRGSFKNAGRRSDISPAKNEAEMEDYVSEVSENTRGRARKLAEISPQGSEQGSRKLTTGRIRVKKQQNSKQAGSYISTESDSDKFTNTAPAFRKSERRCGGSTEKTEQADHNLSDFHSSKQRAGSILEDEDPKDFGSEHQTIDMANKFQRSIEHTHSDFMSSDNEGDRDMKPVKCHLKVTPQWKFQPLQHLLGESDLLEWPTDDSSHHKPRVKKKQEERGSRKAVPFECEVCGRSIQSKAMLKRHMLSHTGEKPFECEECGKKYTSRSNLRIHQLSHSGKMDYTCSECGRKFTHLPYLQRHLLRHSGKKIHICEHCGKGFIQKYHLVRHGLIHTKQTPHVCDKCGLSFSRTDYLKLHLRNVHHIDRSTPNGNPEKRYKCETCNKYFANHSSLETHKRVHTGDTPYSCIICSRQFKQSSHLYSHMNTHSSEKPHACNLCELKFTRKSYLRKHKERVHSGAGDSQST